MKVKGFASNNIATLEQKINYFIENENVLVIDIKFSACESFDTDRGEIDFTFSALIIYEQGICNE